MSRRRSQKSPKATHRHRKRRVLGAASLMAAASLAIGLPASGALRTPPSTIRGDTQPHVRTAQTGASTSPRDNPPSYIAELTTAGHLVRKLQGNGGLEPEKLLDYAGKLLVLNDSQGSGYVDVLDESSGKTLLLIPPSYKDKGYDLYQSFAMAITDRDHLWIVNHDPASVTEVSLVNGSLIRVIRAASYHLHDAWDITASDDHVFAIDLGGHTVTEINATNGALIRVIHASADELSTGSIVSNRSNVWVANGTSITQLSATSGKLIRVIPHRAEQMVVCRNSLWVFNGIHSLTAVSVATGDVGPTVNLGSTAFKQGTSLAANSDDVWVLNRKANVLYEVAPTSHSVVRVIHPPLETRAVVGEVAADAKSVWVAYFEEHG